MNKLICEEIKLNMVMINYNFKQEKAKKNMDNSLKLLSE